MERSIHGVRLWFSVHRGFVENMAAQLQDDVVNLVSAKPPQAPAQPAQVSFDFLLLMVGCLHLSTLAHRSEQSGHARRESLPDSRHFGNAFLSCRRQGVVLAWMPRFGLYPLAAQKPETFETAEKRINSAFGDEQVRITLESSEYFQAIQSSAPQSGQDGQFERSFAKLHF